jgi:hypothetical protein
MHAAALIEKQQQERWPAPRGGRFSSIPGS